MATKKKPSLALAMQRGTARAEEHQTDEAVQPTTKPKKTPKSGSITTGPKLVTVEKSPSTQPMAANVPEPESAPDTKNVAESETTARRHGTSVAKPRKSISARANIAPSRIGTKAITGHFAPDVARQLKMIAVEHDSTVQALLGEALGDLFEKYGRDRLA